MGTNNSGIGTLYLNDIPIGIIKKFTSTQEPNLNNIVEVEAIKEDGRIIKGEIID
jgi:hypothetical protein